MKILYSTRLFSGIESSFSNKKWSPSGVPTIYKLIEELDRQHDSKFIFSSKDSGDGYQSLWRCQKDKTISVSGLNRKVNILAGIRFFPSWVPRRIAMILRESRQFMYIVLATLRFRPDIIYCDHANVFVGAFLARIQRHSLVVFRVMGVYPSMRRALTSGGIVNRFYRWAYYSPFDLVICTQDGSGVESWLNKAIQKNVRKQVLLNGVDKDDLIDFNNLDSRLKLLPNGKKNILFVGKLEKYKGCYDFLDAIFILLEKGVKDIHAIIIGTGSEEDNLKKIVKNGNYECEFTFIDRLSHGQILAAHKLSCIYVSMNHLGNLSNSNLEAIHMNSCMILPTPQESSGIDTVTSYLLGDSVTYSPVAKPQLLAGKIYCLLSDKSIRDKKLKLLKQRKLKFLWSWNERIKTEVSLLNDLLNYANRK